MQISKVMISAMKKLTNVGTGATFVIMLTILLNACTAQNQVQVNEFEKFLQQPNVVLIDVRTAREFESGHLEKAINIDIYDNQFKEKVLKTDKNKTILVYCRSGNRSAQAASFLRANGYKVVDLAGGIGAWAASGKKIVY